MPAGEAKQVIYLRMQGGMSQFETFDPKPHFHANNHESPAARPIPSRIPDVSISEWMPRTAEILDRCLIFRAIEGPGTHIAEAASHFRMTGYRQRSTIVYPDLGSWCATLLLDNRFFVRIGHEDENTQSWLPETRSAPVVISDAHAALRLAESPTNWENRLQLLKQLKNSDTAASSFLATPDALTALRWDKEPIENRTRYGDHDFGRSCLLASRLVRHSLASFVEVNLKGWETEGPDYWRTIRENCRQLDEAFSALILDLESTGLLDETLVVIASDYGRHGYYTENGRPFSSHYATAVFAGGGIQSGQVIGKTDDNGRVLSGNPIPARQFNGLILEALGLDPHKTEFSPRGRPVMIGNNRLPPLKGIFRNR
ncbi:MAG: DUF1501 domain-containing protein [Verrucomicrobiota bacterium]